MKYIELIAPCHFGLEAVLKREILDLGYEISSVEDGKVTFLADAQGIAETGLLPWGEYEITETGVPDGYIDSGFTATVWIN